MNFQSTIKQKPKLRIKRLLNFEKRAAVLMYHRVADLPPDPYNLSVTPGNFYDQLTYIKRTCIPLSLSEFINSLWKGNIPDRAVVLTFDDGYLNNYTHALPALEAVGIPATCFITTGKTGSAEEFWWDKLERIFIRTPDLPPCLQLSIRDQEYKWDTSSKEQLSNIYRLVHKLLRDEPEGERNDLLDQLLNWSKSLPISDEKFKLYRPMSKQELREFSNHPLIEIGAHSVSHPPLASLTEEQQSAEIIISKETLASYLRKEIRFFSYPYGSHSELTVKLVKDAGFGAAFTTKPGYIRKQDNGFQLNRWPVQDWDIVTFENMLEEFFLYRNK